MARSRAAAQHRHGHANLSNKGAAIFGAKAEEESRLINDSSTVRSAQVGDLLGFGVHCAWSGSSFRAICRSSLSSWARWYLLVCWWEGTERRTRREVDSNGGILRGRFTASTSARASLGALRFSDSPRAPSVPGVGLACLPDDGGRERPANRLAADRKIGAEHLRSWFSRFTRASSPSPTLRPCLARAILHQSASPAFPLTSERACRRSPTPRFSAEGKMGRPTDFGLGLFASHHIPRVLEFLALSFLSAPQLLWQLKKRIFFPPSPTTRWLALRRPSPRARRLARPPPTNTPTLRSLLKPSTSA